VVANKKSNACQVKERQIVTEKRTLGGKSRTVPQASPVATIDRRESKERRSDGDRRTQGVPVVAERRTLERRVKVNRRRQIDPTTCERDYTSDEIEFMGAMDEYKRRNGRMFPTCSEVLEVVKSLGYQKCGNSEMAALTPVGLPVAATQNSISVGCGAV
jgi:hypothetical protein